MMPGLGLIRGRIWLTVLIVFVLFALIGVVTPNNDLIIASHVMRIAASAVVVFVYWPEALAGLMARAPRRTDFLITGIVFSFASNLLQSLNGLVGRMGGLPQWWLSNDFVGPTLLLSVVAAVLHVTAPGAVDGKVPQRNRLATGAGFGLAVLAITILGITQPDIGPALEKVRPYIQGSGYDDGSVRPL